MLLSRWKLMAGVLGVSIGGLAAAASQCPKFDKSKGRTPETPVAKADMKLPPAGAPSAPELPPLPPSAAPAIPAAPQLTPAGATTPAIPPAPTLELPKPADVTPPALPPIPATTTPTPLVDLVPPAPTKPASDPLLLKPPTNPTLPPSNKATPTVPPVTFDATPPSKPTGTQPPTTGPDGRGLFGTPMFTGPGGEVLPLNPTKPVVGAGATQPGSPSAPVASPPAPPSVPDFPPPMRAEVPPSQPPFVPQPAPPAPVAETRFRILLRVGDGEPMFEVKNGDNLVLKVSCEKVDIKSPEKGGGMSEVIARGKVRFAGFGAEGTCDELKFLAGTGEVLMTGDVKVQVKDKLGRVESELTTTTMKYKIDASSVGGAIKP